MRLWSPHSAVVVTGVAGPGERPYDAYGGSGLHRTVLPLWYAHCQENICSLDIGGRSDHGPLTSGGEARWRENFDTSVPALSFLPAPPVAR